MSIYLHLASFYATNYFWKKLATVREMLFEQIFEFRGPGPPRPYMYSYNWLFSWQNSNI